VVSSACPGDFFCSEEGCRHWEWGWKTLVEKRELESRMLVLLAHRSPPLCVCIGFTVDMESRVVSGLMNWEVRVEFPVLGQME